MASMDKQSVRNEFDKLKSQFGELQEQNKVSSDIKALVGALFLLMELMLAIFLERKTKKDSKKANVTGKAVVPPSPIYDTSVVVLDTVMLFSSRANIADNVSHSKPPILPSRTKGLSTEEA